MAGDAFQESAKLLMCALVFTCSKVTVHFIMSVHQITAVCLREFAGRERRLWRLLLWVAPVLAKSIGCVAERW
jgi:DMSO reductase anchor subunit